jgi:hypothetical protein
MRAILDETNNRPEHWGATKTYTAPWADGQERPILNKPPYKAMVRGEGHYCVPQVQSLLLVSSFILTPTVADNFAFRWVLKVGAGGTQARILLDAVNTQQISVAGENLVIGMLAEKYNPNAAFETPIGSWTGSVTIADGNVSSGQATYTQAFRVPALNTVIAQIPAMATSFRLQGRTISVATPFVAGFHIEADSPIVNVTWEGNGFSQYGDAFVPIPGRAQTLSLINTTANDIFPILQWGLDL